jgi:ParB-like chromosome segregation protein Spo0J
VRSFNDQEQLEVALIENLQREDLTPLEMATAFLKLNQQFNQTMDMIAERIGKFIRQETDTGPIIAQAAVPVLAGDTPDTLGARVLAAEHKLYPLALRLIAEGRVTVEDDRAIVDGKIEPTVLLSPANAK